MKSSLQILLLVLFLSVSASAAINVREAPYNAVGDGVANDTVALTTALADAQAQRTTLFVPCGDYLVSGSGAQIFLITRPSIEWAGEGIECSRIIVSMSTSQSTDIVRIVPPATGGQPTGAWAMQENGRDNRGLKIHDLAFIAQSEPSLYTTPYPSQPGRHAFHIDISQPGQFLHNVTFSRVRMGSFSAQAIWVNNLKSDGSWQNLDGFYQSSFRDCIIRNGVLGDWWGDSILFDHCSFHGMFPAIESTQVTGATTLTISNSGNITNRGGIIIHNGYQINIENNIIELFFIPSNPPNESMIDFRGDKGKILKANIRGNAINAIGTPLHCIRLDNITHAEIAANLFHGQANRLAVFLTSQAVNTEFGMNFMGGHEDFLLTNTDSAVASFRAYITTTNLGGGVTGRELKIDNFTPAGLSGLYFNSGLGVPSGAFVQYNNGNGPRNLFISTATGDPVYFGTNNTPRIAIQPGGNLTLLGNGNGVELKSPSGICKRLTVDDAGAIVVSPC